MKNRSSRRGARCLLLVSVNVWAAWVVLTVVSAGEVSKQKPSVAASQVRNAAADATQTPPKKNIDLAGGPAAEWIWGGEAGAKDRYTFRKEFEGGSKAATLIAACDNRMLVFVNGARVTQSSTWEAPVTVDVQKYLKDGKNVLTVQGNNEGGPAGLALKLVLTLPDGKKRYLVTDKTWQAARGRKAAKWSKVVVLGKMGIKPWGDVFSAPKIALAATKRDVFNVLPGFKVELLYTVPRDKQGSWVCIAFDGKGRLLASDQGGKGLFRVTPPKIGSDEPTEVESLDVKMTACQGMLEAFGSLYCSVNGGPGSGFYRLRDTDGDDQYDEVKLLRRLQGGGEHGPHALRLSPDGKSIYLIAGNHTNPPFEVKRSAPPQTLGGSRKEPLQVQLPAGASSRMPANWDEDLLLPRQWDARGHARGKLAPGGWIAKTDPDGKTWELISSGYRNPYDMAFNADGELFAYDADMEWDMGSPWYRPTRVVHAVSGSEFGWRSGTGKWPTYYPDCLPTVVDTGPGSPVGVEFGYGTKFPAKYQKALYILDWTFGTIYAIHLKPQGASYVGQKEEFLSRTPLPLTDAAVGPDGAMYFAIGGRGTQSELYRVTYVGDESTTPFDARDKEGAELRKLRNEIEAYHHPKHMGERPMTAASYLTGFLSHEDRHIRYAARVGLEQRSPPHNDYWGKWNERVLASDDPDTVIHGVVALARQANAKVSQQALLAALDKLPFEKLTTAQQLNALRAYALTFIRLGEPNTAAAARIAKRLDASFPSKNKWVNRELARVLVYLNSPTVIDKTLKEMEKKSKLDDAGLRELIARNPGYGGPIAKMLANHPDLQWTHYALVLRNMRYGWTLEQRKRYFEMLADLRTKSGGASYQGFIDNIRKEALANASAAERKALEGQVTLKPPKPEELPKPIGPGQKWTVEELASLTKDGLTGRDYEKGRRAYAASRCVVCHRFGGEGGATGPDLTNVAGRFNYRDLAEAIIEPSKVISDQYRGHFIITEGGKQYPNARVLSKADDGKLTVLIDPEDATKVIELAKGDVAQMQPSKLSLMPKDLLLPLNRDEVLDLLAYLLSRGNPNDPMFKQ